MQMYSKMNECLKYGFSLLIVSLCCFIGGIFGIVYENYAISFGLFPLFGFIGLFSYSFFHIALVPIGLKETDNLALSS